MPAPPGETRKAREERQKRKRLLQDELRLVQEQKASLEKQLALLMGGGSAAAPALAATPTASRGLKRPAQAMMQAAGPPLPEESRDAKRARLEAERYKRTQALLQQAVAIVKAIKKIKEARPFTEPVDPVANRVPDYFNIIKHPMDLGTVIKKSEHRPERNIHRKYASVYELRDDVRLVWANCRTYNPPGTDVRVMGDKMSDNWERRWQAMGLEAKWEEEMRRQKAEEMELDGETDVSGAELPRKAAELNDSLRDLAAKAEAQNRLPPLILPPNRDMTFEEKRKLSMHLGMMPPERLADVVEIVRAAVGEPPAGEDGEVELEIDDLDIATLWRLDELARSALGLAGGGVKKEALPALPKPKQPAAGGAAAASQGQPQQQQQQQEETTSKPAGASGAASGGSAGGEKGDNSSSSSSSGDSSSDGSHQEEEVGSRDNVGSTLEAGRGQKIKRAAADGAGDLTTLVSATRPSQQGQILKSSTQRKEPTVTNAAAWTALAAVPPEGAEPGAEPGAGGEGGAPGEEKAGDGDDLWKDFAKRADEEQKRKEEKEQQEKALQQKREEEQRKAAEEAEAQRLQQAMKEEDLRREEEQKLQARRAAEQAALEKGEGAVDLTSQQAMMKDFDKAGGGALPGTLEALGLAKADDDGSDDDDDSDDDE